MSESNQEGYRTLGWIMSKSEQGLFIVVADELIQKEIVGIYRQGAVEFYDYKQHPGEYSFRDLQEWVTGLPETQIFMIVNFHLAVQSEESLKRLNFSRDMINGLGKNFIFLVTPYGDDRIATGAYDFYSFVKLRITFHNYGTKREKDDKLLSVSDRHEKDEQDEAWEAKDLKQKLAEAYMLVEQAKNEKNSAHYCESEKLLLEAREIKEKLLGTEHLEIAEINYELGEVYERQGDYNKAEELCNKSLRIREEVLGEEHPDTAAGYDNLALVYGDQGKYVEAEELHKKALLIREKVLGEEHPSVATAYNNLAKVYVEQGKYEMSLIYCFKAYKIFVSKLGMAHPRTQIVYDNMKLAYLNWKSEESFEQWLEEKKKE